MEGKGRWAPLIGLVVAAPLVMPFAACFGLGAGMFHGLVHRAALRSLRGCRPAPLGGASLLTTFSFLLLLLMALATSELLHVSFSLALIVASYVHAFFLSPYSFAVFHVVDPDANASLEDTLCGWDALEAKQRRIAWLIRGSAAAGAALVAELCVRVNLPWFAFVAAAWVYAVLLAFHGVHLARLYERQKERVERVHIPRRYGVPLLLTLAFSICWGLVVVVALTKPTPMEVDSLPAGAEPLAVGGRLPGTDLRIEGAGRHAVRVEAADGGGTGEVRRRTALAGEIELYFQRRGTEFVVYVGPRFERFTIDRQGVRRDDSHADRFREHIGLLSLALMLLAMLALAGALWLVAPATQHLRRLSHLGRLGEGSKQACVEAVLYVSGLSAGEEVPEEMLAGARIEATHEQWRWQIPEGGVELGTDHVIRASESVTFVGTFDTVEKGVRDAFAPWPKDAILVAGMLDETVADALGRLLRPSRLLALSSAAFALSSLILAAF